MQYYKATDNSLHFIDPAFEYLLPDGCVPITDEEAKICHQNLILAQSQDINKPVTKVTMRQARLALLNAGLLNQVNAAVAALPGIEGDAARIEWEFSNSVERNKSFVQSIAYALGLSESQLDEIFKMASTL